ncbi:hypothetical protein GCM10027074_05020 [Streptomyces deserti]
MTVASEVCAWPAAKEFKDFTVFGVFGDFGGFRVFLSDGGAATGTVDKTSLAYLSTGTGTRSARRRCRRAEKRR